MESALLMIDAIAVAALVFASLRNDRLGPDQPQNGPFRYAVRPAPPPRPER